MDDRIIGSIYAIFGGLKAVAVSDTVNGVGLIIGGLAIPVLGFIYLGEGSMIKGIEYLFQHNPENLMLLVQKILKLHLVRGQLLE